VQLGTVVVFEELQKVKEIVLGQDLWGKAHAKKALEIKDSMILTCIFLNSFIK